MEEVFEVYGRTTCPWCDSVKALLDRHNCKYTFKNIETNTTYRAEFINKFPGAMTVPQVTVNGIWLGGFEQTRKHLDGYN